MIDWQSTTFSSLAITTLVGIVIALVYSLLALNRRTKHKAIWYRLIFISLNIMLGISLLGLLLRPSIRVNTPQTVTLYTEGVTLPTQLSQNSYLLLNKVHLISNDFIIRNQQQIIFDIDQLFEKEPNLNELTVVGDGVVPEEITKFANLKINYQPPLEVLGLVDINWNQSIELGERLIVSGSLQANNQQVYNLQLLDPAQQVVHEAGLINGNSFELGDVAKIVGKHLYSLKLTNSQGDIISEQRLAVSITKSSAVRVLVLQSSPSFETKQLQNWASEQGAEFLIRTRISKQKFITRSTNLAKELLDTINKNRIRPDRYNQFDLLIIDSRELSLLTSRQLQDLEQAVRQGLGLLILADGSPNQSKGLNLQKEAAHLKTKQLPRSFSFDFEYRTLATDIRTDLIRADRLSSQDKLAESVLLTSQPLFSLKQPNQAYSPLVVNPQGHVVVASKSVGMGQVAVSIIKQSFQLRTSDQLQSYAKLWSYLIHRTARSSLNSNLSQFPIQQLARINQAQIICYQASSDDNLLANAQSEPLLAQVVTSKNNTLTIPLLPSPLRLNHYCGKFWPHDAGWHQIKLAGLVKSVFVHSQTDWQAHQQHTSIKSTQLRAQQQTTKSSVAEHWQPLSDWWFWSIIVFSAGLIWIERKYWSETP